VKPVVKMPGPELRLRLIAPKWRNVGNRWFKRGTLLRAVIDTLRKVIGSIGDATIRQSCWAVIGEIGRLNIVSVQRRWRLGAIENDADGAGIFAASNDHARPVGQTRASGHPKGAHLEAVTNRNFKRVTNHGDNFPTHSTPRQAGRSVDGGEISKPFRERLADKGHGEPRQLLPPELLGRESKSQTSRSSH